MSGFDDIGISQTPSVSTYDVTGISHGRRYAAESKYTGDGIRIFLNHLEAWTSSIRHLAPDDEKYAEEPPTPVSGKFDEVVQAYRCYVLLINKRGPDDNNTLCMDMTCCSIRDALSMALYAIRDILRQNRKLRAWYWTPQDDQDSRDLKMSSMDRNMEAATVSLASSVLDEMRQGYEKFAREMQLREEDRTNHRGGMHGNKFTMMKWNAVGQVQSNARRRSSDKGLNWRDKVLVEKMSFYGNQVDRGTQWEDDAEDNDPVSGHEDDSLAAEELIAMVEERLRGKDNKNNAEMEAKASLSTDDASEELPNGRRQNLEDEGVVFNMPEVIPTTREEVPPSPQESDTATGYTATGYSFSTSEENDNHDYKDCTDYEGIKEWTEDVAWVAGLEASNADLREAVQRLQKEKGNLQKQLNATRKDLKDRQDFIEGLVTDGQPPAQNRPDDDLVWAFDPLLSYFVGHVQAWRHTLAYISFKTLKFINPLLNGSADVLQRWSLRLFSRRVGLLDTMKLSTTRPVKAPSPCDVAYLVKQFVVMLIMQGKEYLVPGEWSDEEIYAEPCKPTPLMGEGVRHGGSQTCGVDADSEALVIFLAQFSEIWIEYLIEWFVVALNMSSVLKVWWQIAKQYWAKVVGLGHLTNFLLWVFSGH
ncbi:hypothetical protein PT974_09263 [Cladobotryum mycophilum]|uniref:Uncharacterized protein n=1 Tax=Cladobotryum mycophilum TaxID=491253 RepID=A0ABR0SFL9_9HYPO